PVADKDPRPRSTVPPVRTKSPVTLIPAELLVIVVLPASCSKPASARRVPESTSIIPVVFNGFTNSKLPDDSFTFPALVSVGIPILATPVPADFCSVAPALTVNFPAPPSVIELFFQRLKSGPESDIMGCRQSSARGGAIEE